MREPRFLIRLANHPAAHPSQHATLLERLRRLATPLPGAVMNLRVTPYALEFDLFGVEQDQLAAYFRQWQRMGAVDSFRRLDGVSRAVVDPARLIDEARGYFNQARYWEVHEVLEDLWKALTGDEKRLVQGLILLAAAQVHDQKNELNVVWPMIEEGLSRLQDQPEDYYSWNITAFRTAFQQMLQERVLRPLKV